MPKLSPKENYMLMLNGEIPEYVPAMMDGMDFSFMGRLGPDLGGPFTMSQEPSDEVIYDMFGVPYVAEWNANNGRLPQPGVFILEDITKWRDVIKRPAVLDGIDWAYLAAEQCKDLPEDYEIGGGLSVGNGYFQLLVSFMGFDNGLIACMEEPEEVKDLLNFILELNLELTRNFIDHYGKYRKITSYGMADDIAHDRAPFISLEVFTDIFEPMWRATAKPYVEMGCHASHHNCGKLEEFIPYIVDMGFDSWNPAEPQNDLVAIKEQFKGKLAICGGFASNGLVCYPETTDDEIRAYVKQQLDLLAPGGGYAFGGYVMGPPGDEEAARRMKVINDEFERLRYSYY